MNPPYGTPPQYQPPPDPPEPKYRFRWSLLGIPLAIGVVLFLINNIDSSFQFEDVMRFLNVNNQNRYVRLACLCVFSLVVLLVYK